VDRKVSNSDLSGTSKEEDLIPTSGSSNGDNIDDNNQGIQDQVNYSGYNYTRLLASSL